LVPIRDHGGGEKFTGGDGNGSFVEICGKFAEIRRAWGKKELRLQNCIAEGNAWGSNKSLIMKTGLGVRARNKGRMSHDERRHATSLAVGRTDAKENPFKR
jgi:hypothetical protein